MKILAVDTASFPASAAVAEDGIILGEYVIRNKKKHSQNLMVMVERLLDDLDTDISEMDMFAVTVGPGSFTGLRIGIATVRAFAQATGKPVIGINTLEALAYNHAGSDLVVIPMLDARRDEVFTAAYSFDGNEPRELLAPTVMTIDKISALFSERTVIYTGDGMQKHRNEIPDNNAIFAPAHLSETRASSLAALALARSDEAVGYNMIVPLYLRKSQAEREFGKKGSEV